MRRLALVLALFTPAAAEAGGWTVVPSGIADDLHNVAFAGGPGVAYAVGNSGRILKSIDGGASWVFLVSGTSNQLLAVDFPVDSMEGYAVGTLGTILKTTDGGANWIAQTSGTGAALRAVTFPVDATTGFAAGDGGVVLKTTNGGTTWSPLASGTTNNLRGMDFPSDPITGYIVGDGGVIRKTTNGGASFSPLLSGTSNGLLDVDFPTDAATGYAAGVSVIVKTVDGGGSWAQQPVGTAITWTGIRFSSGSTVGYVVGFGGAIARTTDGGANWFRQPSPTATNLTAVDFGSAATGLAVGQAGVILRTTDGGDPTIALHPTQNGSSTAFTGSSGCPSGKWDCANDQPGNAGIGHPAANDGAATVILDGDTFTNRESFRLVDGVVPASATVVAIEVRAAVGIGPGTGQNVALSYQRMGFDGAPVDGPNRAIGSSCCTTTLSWFISGLSWTTGELDALEIGIRHVSGGEVQASQVFVVVTYQAPPPEMNYRSIGTRANYGTTEAEGPGTTVAATNGSAAVVGAGTAWITANRGRGDRITIQGVDYTVLSVASETSLTLASPYAGATGSGKTYVIARKFADLISWEDCIDGPPGVACPAVTNPSLIVENRSEVGVAYNDSFLAGDIVINGSITDPTHTITLTADGPNRHQGVAGSGAFIYNFSGTSHAIVVQDEFVTVEWLDIHASSTPGTDGIRVTGVSLPNRVVLRNLIIRESSSDGIELADPDLVADVFNNVIYHANIGIRSTVSLSSWSDLRLLNNTLYGCTTSGISDTGSSPRITLVNNLAAANGSDFSVFGIAPGSDHNLSTDATAPGPGSLVDVPLTSIGFVSLGAGTEDLHLLPASPAVDSGRDMGALLADDLDGDLRSAPWDMGADELNPAPAPTLSSAENQSFAVGGSPQAASVKTIIDDPSSATITALKDIRIRIPLGFPMQWDPTVTTVALGGLAAGKVDDDVKAIEDSGRTVVLDVTADFLPGDVVTVSGLKFYSFTAPATPNHLELEVTDDGATSAEDDKTIDIFPTGVPRLSSDADQGFVAGSPPVPMVQLTISDASPAVITAAAGLRVRIPALFNMTWNFLDTSAVISGPAASKVSSTVAFEDGNKTLVLNVLTDFTSGDFVSVSGLSFAGFTGVSGPDELELEVDNLDTVADFDDKRIFINGASDVSVLTATAKSLQVEVQWVFPDGGACNYVRIVRDTGGFPGPSGGTLVTDAPCAGFLGMPFSAVDAPPSNDVEYFYAAYVHTGATYTPGRFVTARPFDTSGKVKWAYSTGATSMAAPGLRFSGGNSYVYVVSNDSILHGLRGGGTGGNWAAGFEPYKLSRPAQSRPPVVSFTVGSANGAVFLSSEDGSVHAVDATDGSLEWTSPVANVVLGAPAGYFTNFDAAASNVVLVGTRNASAANTLKALDVDTGNPVWSFVNSVADGEGQEIGIISGGVSVDYLNDLIYFTSRQRASGSSDTLWAIDPTPSLIWNANLGNIDGSPVLYNGRVYVGTVSGAVAVRDAATGLGGWSLPLGDGAIKGFVFPRYGTSELFVSTNAKIWAIADNTGSGAVISGWPVTSIASPSIPLHPPGSTRLLVGSGDGKLYQIDVLSPSTPASVVLGDGSGAVGAPTLDLPKSMIYVGTDAGIIYGVSYPLP